MKPTIVLVGRPNVGKSTLFNRLTATRDALVANMPGLTRDRHYGEGRVGGRPYLAVDTGGLEPVAREGILAEMAKQSQLAISEADVVIFLVDARDGLTPQDRRIAELLRRIGRPVRVAVNKAEGMDRDIASAEFHELGLGAPVAISSAHGDGVRALMEDVLEDFPDPEPEPAPPAVPHIAIIGRPNVGKSTLLNSLLGEERMIAFDQPGTTRDSVDVPFVREGRRYVLIDTAGVRRKGKVFEAIEKFSVIKTLQAIDRANVVVLVLDAQADVSEQDAHLGGFIVERGRALVVAVNKWDGMDDYARANVKGSIERKLRFLDFARLHFISARSGQGLGAVMRSVDEAFAAAMAKLSTPRLTRVLIQAIEKQTPPRAGLVRPKMRYAHQGGMNPPVIVVHGAALDRISAGYERYLEDQFRTAFSLRGTPLRIQFKSQHNPYVDDA
ncbi:MAG: ribosome biogenesis GTPase Der [Burkholderiales bacterium]